MFNNKKKKTKKKCLKKVYFRRSHERVKIDSKKIIYKRNEMYIVRKIFKWSCKQSIPETKPIVNSYILQFYIVIYIYIYITWLRTLILKKN